MKTQKTRILGLIGVAMMAMGLAASASAQDRWHDEHRDRGDIRRDERAIRNLEADRAWAARHDRFGEVRRDDRKISELRRDVREDRRDLRHDRRW